MDSSMGDTLTATICINGEKLQASSFFRFVLVFKLFTCALGFIGSCYLLKTEGIRWVANSNVKIVYAVHIFWSTYIPISFSVHLGFDFIRFLTPHSDPCDYTLPLSTGFWIRAVAALGNITQSYTMLSFALERSFSTIFPVKYEKIQSSAFGWILGVGARFSRTSCELTLQIPPQSIHLEMVTSFTHIFILIVMPNKSFPGRGFVTSLVTPLNSDNYTLHLLIIMCMEITTVTMFTLNLVVNRIQQRRLKIGSIGYKYQIKETSKLINALLPCFWIHFIIFLTPMVVLSWRRKIGPPLTDVENIEWIEVLSMYQLYSIFMPGVVLLLRRRERRRTVVNGHHNMEDHFQQLHAIFK